VLLNFADIIIKKEKKQTNKQTNQRTNKQPNKEIIRNNWKKVYYDSIKKLILIDTLFIGINVLLVGRHMYNYAYTYV